MGITIRRNAEYVPHPAGLTSAVIAGVEDIGPQEGRYGSKLKIDITFQSELRMPNGKKFELNRWYTQSLHEKSALRHDIEKLLMRPLTEEELRDGYDVEKLIGRQCKVKVIHVPRTQGEGVWANIEGVYPPDRDQQVEIESYDESDPWEPDSL